MKHSDMNDLVAYLNKLLGLEASISSELNYDDTLPAYIASSFRFYLILTQSHEFILAWDRAETKLSPSRIKNMIDATQEKLQSPVIYATKSLHRDSRRDLIKYKLPFVVPGFQLYLPILGIDFRERLAAEKQIPRSLSPLTQVTALHVLLKRNYQPFNNSQLVECLGYSIATASRVIKELAQIGVLECKNQNKEQICAWSANGKELWNMLMPYLSNPAKSSCWFGDKGQLPGTYPMAGLSALARFSRIAEPGIPVLACTLADFRELSKREDCRPYAWPDSVLIQAWKYDPALLSDKLTVDQLSLYLSMKDDPDERTQICLEEMLEAFPW